MTLTENTHVHTVYFLQVGEGSIGWNFMGTTYREGDGPWQLEYRFRYFREGDNNDEKHWYRAKDVEDVDKLNKLVRTVGQAMAEETGQDLEILKIDGGVDAFMAAMNSAPWATQRLLRGDGPGKPR